MSFHPIHEAPLASAPSRSAPCGKLRLHTDAFILLDAARFRIGKKSSKKFEIAVPQKKYGHPVHFFSRFAFGRHLTFGMNQDFKILIEFLDQFGVEAAGRELPEPQTDTAMLLERFARGECSQEERAEVCRMLRLHPAWLRWLADRVKLARETAAV